MAQVQITDLPQALPLTGAESVPIVQDGVTVRTTTGAISGAGALNYPFLTVGSTAGLTQARYLSTNSGLTLTDNGAGSTLQINLTGAALSLDTSSNGIQVKTNSNTVTGRSLAVGAGLGITNADGVSGDPTVSLGAFLQNFVSLTGTGMLAIQSGSVGKVNILGTSSQTTILNGDGSSNVVISLANNTIIPGNGGLTLPNGATSQRVNNLGAVRYNTDLSQFEGYTTTGWNQFSLTGGVISFSAGTTGFTPTLPTTGAVVLGGVLNVSSGGTGATSLTGYVYGNGTSAFTASLTVPTTDLSGTISNAQLANSAITINGSSVSLGGSITVTATASNPLTIGTGLTGGSYDGSAPVTIAIDSTVVTLTGTQTLTNKTISGASNTLTNIGNSSLTNSSLTYNGVTVSLGGSGTITAVNPNALTIGTGLTGTSYNGSTPVTIAIDSTVATLTGIQTLTNKSMSGASNTFTNIPNSALSNYTISGVALGGNLFGLTIGTGLTGGSYDGSGAVTVAIDSTVATLTGTQTLTNKSISGSTNTLTNIPNSALTNSSVTIGTTNVALGGTVTTLAGLTSITLTQDPVSDLQVATKQYVDSIASGLNYHQPVNYASTAALPAYTYNNGASGVGATITAVANGALSFGGGSPTVGQRLLVKDEAGANQPYNGIYTVTQTGSLLLPFILTRATDYDSSGTGTNEIDAGDYVLVLSGTNASTAWVQQTPLPITVGTTPLVFLQFNAPITYNAGTGLNLSPATTFNISNTGVTAATYGSASQSLTLAINAQGQITSASAQSISINGNQITSGTVGSAYISGSYTGITGVGTLTAGTWNATVIDPAYGGTGLSSYAVGNLIYATGTTTLAKLAIGTSGQYLSSTGTAPQWSSPAALTKTDDTNVTLTLGGSPTTALLNAASITVGWTGQLSTTRGGTGLSSYTAGDLVYYATGTALSKLAIGTSNQILTSSGTAPQWTSGSSITVGTATNAVNVGITADSTNVTRYLTFVSGTSGNLPELVNSSITCNPSTGSLTGGIAGGSF